MSATTATTALSGTTYTAISSGSASGVVQHRGGQMVRVAFGTSAPADAATDYMLIGSIGNLANSFSWSGLAGADNVYVRPDSGSAVVSTSKS